MSLTSELIFAAREAGADLVGIAPIERFEGVNAEHHPCSIFPEARSVVVIAKRIVRGCLRGIEEGTQFELFRQFAVNWVPNRFLALTTVTTATYLEDRGWEAVPMPNLPVETPTMGVPVRSGLPAPNVMMDFDDAAVRAGLGQIGYVGELLTPQYGPRQKLQVILTDAELEGSPLCEESVCDYCKACVQACPLDAMDESRQKEVQICGLRMPIAQCEWKICEICKNGAAPNPHHPAGRPDRLGAVCVRACVHHLEEIRGVRNRFEHPFRKRPVWQMDAAGRTLLVQEEEA